MPQQFIKAKQIVTNQAGGLLEINGSGKVDMSFLDTGVANGVATLDANGNINADFLNGQDYEEVIVSLNGSFNAGEQAKIARVGNWVVLSSASGAWTHGSTQNPASAAGIIPAAFRPTGAAAHNAFSADATRIAQLIVSTSGQIIVNYRDWTGTLLTLTDSTVGPFASWVIV